MITHIEEILIAQESESLIWTWAKEEEYYFKNYDFYLKGSIFEDFALVWSWFKPRQLKLLKKYFSLTPEETEEFCATENDEKTIYTLKFHLEIREKNSKKGILIPFGLWSDRQRLFYQP